MDITFWLLVLTAIVAGVLSALYLFFSIRFTYWKKKGIPYIKPNFPSGNISDIMFSRKTMGEVYKDFYNHFSGNKFAGIYQLHRPTLLLLDPELIKSFLVKDFEHFHDHGIIVDETVDPLAVNLFTKNGKKWKELRSRLTPTFSSGKMKLMFQKMVECGLELKKHFEQSADKADIVEIKDVMARYTTDIIASCAFGIECNCLKYPEAEFRQWGKKAFEPTIRHKLRDVFYNLIPTVAIALKFPFVPKDVRDFFRGVVKETVEYREKNKVKRNDFMQLLIELKNQETGDSEEKNGDSTTMTLDNLASQAFMFFIAGFESSSTTMSFCLYEMALNPDIQRRVRDEIDAILYKHDGILTYEALMQMTYLDKTIYETLRKYPPVPFLTRECTKDYKIPDTDITVEKGLLVLIPTMGLQYDPKHFPDPEKFNPERFSEKVKAQRHQYSYLPFGEGPRICIGMRFALMQTKVGLVSLLSKYEFHACDKTATATVYDPKTFVLFSKGGCWLQVKNRTK